MCRILMDVSFPKPLCIIGAYYFEGCTDNDADVRKSRDRESGVARIVLILLVHVTEGNDFPDPLTKMGGYDLYGCSTRMELGLLDRVEDIGTSLCYACSSLMDVSFWLSLKSISTSALFWYESL